MTDFEKLIGALAGAGAEFIIGGAAAVAHGSSRFTQDLDIVYAREPANLVRLTCALAPFAPYLRDVPPGLPFVFDEGTLARGLNFTLTTTIGDIDLLGEIAGGGDYVRLRPHTIDVELFGHRCLCLDLPTLIEVKRAAGRPKDLAAVAELELIRDRQRDT
jgi:hypothetical protein